MKVLRAENGFVVLRFDRGEDFLENLHAWCAESGVSSAVVLGGIGMLEGIEIGRFDGTEYSIVNEKHSCEVLSLQGNISMKNNQPFVHLHVSFADHNFNVLGGHLFGAKVSVTIELVLVQFAPGLVRKQLDGGVFWQLDTST